MTKVLRYRVVRVKAGEAERSNHYPSQLIPPLKFALST